MNRIEYSDFNSKVKTPFDGTIRERYFNKSENKNEILLDVERNESLK